MKHIEAVYTPKKCFIVMSYGHTDEEIAWYSGWYKECIVKGVELAQYTPILAAAEHKPVAINDAIRSHLVYDEMVLCDLGGMHASDEPNPNVMYELGIRHAFGLPLVIMGWKGQKIPFDVANQRVILESRRFLDIQVNVQKIHEYIQAAEHGDYYRPMEAVERTASLAQAATLTTNDALRALVKEVASLKDRMGLPVPKPRIVASKASQSQIFHVLGTSEKRDLVKSGLSLRGIKEKKFKLILGHTIPADILPLAKIWDSSIWVEYLIHRINNTPFDITKHSSVPNTLTPISEKIEPTIVPVKDELSNMGTE